MTTGLYRFQIWRAGGCSIKLGILEALRERPAKARRAISRIIEGMREVGVLLIAFAPLDVALSSNALADDLPILVLFLGLGGLLFLAALYLEWRRA